MTYQDDSNNLTEWINKWQLNLSLDEYKIVEMVVIIFGFDYYRSSISNNIVEVTDNEKDLHDIVCCRSDLGSQTKILSSY
jgi:hypothetical protein